MPLALAVVALSPATAPAVHVGPADVLASGRGQAQCLAATGDGATVLFRRGPLRVTDLDGSPAVALGDAEICGALGAGTDGSALVAGARVRAFDDATLVFADRPAGGPFAPFAAQSTADVAVATDGDDVVALGGGQALLAATVRGTPALVRRDPAGSVTALALPRPVEPAFGPAGPAVGLDAQGRGLVAWVAEGIGLVAATVATDGTVGSPTRLGPAPGSFGALRVAVGPDGAAAVGWSRGAAVHVVTGSTAGGVDPATRRSGRVRGNVALALDPAGAAVAAGARDVTAVRGEALLTSAAAGRPFTRPRRYRLAQGQDVPPEVALGTGGDAAVVLPRRVGVASRLDDVRLVTGRAGAVGGPARRVPVAGGRVLELAAAVDASGRAVALANVERFVGDPRAGVVGQRYAIAAHRLRAGPARPARGRVTVASEQRLGRRRQAVRATVRCPVACTVRITGATTDDRGAFDASVALRAGRHRLRLPYDNGGGSARFRPLRTPAVAALRTAVVDVRGERRGRARVRIRP